MLFEYDWKQFLDSNQCTSEAGYFSDLAIQISLNNSYELFPFTEFVQMMTAK